jgi:hypothetical protein
MSGEPFDLARPPQDSDDAYPHLYATQREMLPNGIECDTGEDVFWKVWEPFLRGVDEYGRPNEIPKRVPVLDEEHRQVDPYVNQSRWVADCPACGGGMACWDRNPYACCLTCGRMYEVRWQLPAERAEVMRVLAGRPIGNRNWDPRAGETVETLAIENVLMQDVEPVQRHGLLVAAGVDIPNEVTDIHQHFEELRTRNREQLIRDELERAKKRRGKRRS